MNYRQLQIELKTLREQGLIAQDLKLNVSSQVLSQAYLKYEAKQERKRVLNSPISIVWLAIACLSLLIGMVYLILILVIKIYSLIVSYLALRTNIKQMKVDVDILTEMYRKTTDLKPDDRTFSVLKILKSETQ